MNLHTAYYLNLTVQTPNQQKHKRNALKPYGILIQPFLETPMNMDILMVPNAEPASPSRALVGTARNTKRTNPQGL